MKAPVLTALTVVAMVAVGRELWAWHQASDRHMHAFFYAFVWSWGFVTLGKVALGSAAGAAERLTEPPTRLRSILIGIAGIVAACALLRESTPESSSGILEGLRYGDWLASVLSSLGPFIGGSIFSWGAGIVKRSLFGDNSTPWRKKSPHTPPPANAQQ